MIIFHTHSLLLTMEVKYFYVMLLLFAPIYCLSGREQLWSIIEDLIEDYPIDQAVTSDSEPSAEYPDTNDYLKYPICGSLPLKSSKGGACYCGSEALTGLSDLADGDVFCCVAAEDECHYEIENYYHVRCPKGNKQLKSQPCHGQCYNSYTTSKYLWWTASLHCEEEDFCLPIQQMEKGNIVLDPTSPDSNSLLFFKFY